MSNRSIVCPQCGKDNPYKWDEAGRCITCARDAVLGTGRKPEPRKIECFADQTWHIDPAKIGEDYTVESEPVRASHNPDEDGWCRNDGCMWNSWNANSDPECPTKLPRLPKTVEEAEALLRLVHGVPQRAQELKTAMQRLVNASMMYQRHPENGDAYIEEEKAKLQALISHRVKEAQYGEHLALDRYFRTAHPEETEDWHDKRMAELLKMMVETDDPDVAA